MKTLQKSVHDNTTLILKVVLREPKFGATPLSLDTDHHLQLTEDDLSFFCSLLGEEGVVQAAEDLDPMNNDWLGSFQGHSKLALRPSNTAQVQI